MATPARGSTRSPKSEAARRPDVDAARDARYKKAFRRATGVLGLRASAQRWLATPNTALGGINPESLLGTDRGLKDVEDLLGRIEHGVYS